MSVSASRDRVRARMLASARRVFRWMQEQATADTASFRAYAPALRAVIGRAGRAGRRPLPREAHHPPGEGGDPPF